MLTQLRLSFLCFTIASCTLFPPNVMAQWLFSSDAYEDGYDDGYDDAMDDCPCPPPRLTYLSSFYVGAEAGYQSFQNNQWVFLEDDMIGHLRTNTNSYVANIFGGYKRYYPNNFYLGGEVFLGDNCHESTNTLNTLGTTDKVTFSPGTTYGFDVMPGYKLNAGPTVFLRFGYQRTEFEVKEWSMGLFQNRTSVKEWSNGYSVGLGVQSKLYRGFDMRLEYNHICYDSFTNPNTGTKNKPSDNQMTLGVLYNLRF